MNAHSHKLLAAANVLLIVLMFSIATYYHSILPEKVPTRFGIEGKPNAYGSKNSLLMLPFAFSLAQVIILAVVKLRFTLVNKYPYAINLPAFYANLMKLPIDKRGWWVNRYFEALMLFSLGIGIYLAILELSIYEGVRNQSLPIWFYPYIFVVFFMLIPFFAMLAKLNREMEKEPSLVFLDILP